MAASAAPRKPAPKKPAAGKEQPTRSRRQAEIEKIAARIDDDDMRLTDADLSRLSDLVDEEVREAPDSPIGPDGEIRPIQIGQKGQAGSDMAHLFTIGAEKFYIRRTAPVPIMLRFLRECRPPERGGIGRDAAVERAMLSLLGKKALDALADSPEVSDDDFANVFIVVGHILFTSIKEWRAKVDPVLDPSKRAPSN